MIWLLLGCAHRQPALSRGPPQAPESSGQHVVAQLPQGAGVDERAAIGAVLDGANQDFQGCYMSALASEPGAYGSITLRVVLDAQGGVREAQALLSTLADPVFDACILGVVGELSFPEPSRDGLTLRYPLVFTSENTPPEITRALMLNHGLLTLEQEAADLERAAESGETLQKGWIETW